MNKGESWDFLSLDSGTNKSYNNNPSISLIILPVAGLLVESYSIIKWFTVEAIWHQSFDSQLPCTWQAKLSIGHVTNKIIQ